jgi:predicted dinucleotide-binding enzyme
MHMKPSTDGLGGTGDLGFGLALLLSAVGFPPCIDATDGA